MSTHMTTKGFSCVSRFHLVQWKISHALFFLQVLIIIIIIL